MTHSFYRRNLPHWQPEESTIFLTWRLHGSLPIGYAQHIRTQGGDPGRQFLRADRMLDAASIGPVWLNDPEIAGYVEGAIRRGSQLGHYVLRAYVIMPNHVHVLLDPLVDLQRLTNRIKGTSAREANGKLGRTGQPFWQDESFDHWIRDAGQFARTKTYIESNPVKAHLCTKPENWLWSSAHNK